jgi:hypothetical protein
MEKVTTQEGVLPEPRVKRLRFLFFLKKTPPKKRRLMR